jgi:hypothetical protein
MESVVTKTTLVIVLFLNGAVLSSDLQSIETFFTTAEVQSVLKGGICTFSRFGNKIRNTDGSTTIVSPPVTDYSTKELADYDMVTIEKAFFPCDLKTKSRLAFYNTLQQYSNLAGMPYYSQKDKRIQTLVLESDRVNAADFKQKEKDSVHTKIKDTHLDHVRIKDNRFGKILFKSEIFHKENSVVIKQTNIKPLSMFTIRINDKGEYQLITFYLYDEAKRGYFYCAVHALKVRGGLIRKMGRLNPESFANRIRAATVHMAAFFDLDWNERRQVF